MNIKQIAYNTTKGVTVKLLPSDFTTEQLITLENLLSDVTNSIDKAYIKLISFHASDNLGDSFADSLLATSGAGSYSRIELTTNNEHLFDYASRRGALMFLDGTERVNAFHVTSEDPIAVATHNCNVAYNGYVSIRYKSSELQWFALLKDTVTHEHTLVAIDMKAALANSPKLQYSQRHGERLNDSIKW